MRAGADDVQRYYAYHLDYCATLERSILQLQQEIAAEGVARCGKRGAGSDKTTSGPANYHENRANGMQKHQLEYFQLYPVAFVSNCSKQKFEAMRQPFLGRCESDISVLTLLADVRLHLGYYLFQFHFNRNFTYRQLALPPRQQHRVGMFSSRTPHRPNPLGLSLGEIVEIGAGFARVRGLDLLDGTPVLSISEYRAEYDVPGARGGWLESERLINLYYDDGIKGSFGEYITKIRTIQNQEQFLDKIVFIYQFSSVDFERFVKEQLEYVPALSRTHKKIEGKAVKVLGFGIFRILYEIHDDAVTIKNIYCSISKETAELEATIDPEMKKVLQYYEKFE